MVYLDPARRAAAFRLRAPLPILDPSGQLPRAEPVDFLRP